MNKTLVPLLTLLLLVGACRSTDEGAYTGASFGSLLGSAIGGIAGGRYGNEIGTIVGMGVGGAAGAVVGHRNEQKQYRYESREAHPQPLPGEGRPNRKSSSKNIPPQEGTGGGISDSGSLMLHNLRFIDEDGNQTINRRETCKVVFELANRSGRVLYYVVPSLTETSGNKHLSFSAFEPIEQINNGTVLRCTALIKADKRLKAGTADLLVNVTIQGAECLPLKSFQVPTDK